MPVRVGVYIKKPRTRVFSVHQRFQKTEIESAMVIANAALRAAQGYAQTDRHTGGGGMGAQHKHTRTGKKKERERHDGTNKVK